jgi:hypothetical protein
MSHGALAGVLSVASVRLCGKYLGASTSFVRAAGYVEIGLPARRVAQLAYFMKEAPKIDWPVHVRDRDHSSVRYAAAVVSGTFSFRSVRNMWRERFGAGNRKRGAAAFIGGVVAMIGARSRTADRAVTG